MRVLAAMSGGVDSSVAAARAVEAGHDVTGVHLALNRNPGTLREGSRGCCTVEDALDARRVADVLGMPFYVWDFSDRFAEAVVDDFVAEYAAGRTPNPCLRCNERIKFAALLDRAVALGFDAVCTGHYALVRTSADGRRELHRASDEAKDQSYVLGVLTGEQLAHAMFPLGETPSKALVRAEAERRGLRTARKPDSHDICFIPDGDTRGWLADRLGRAPGPVVDEAGEQVGRHDGAVAYTVGQRRGLSLERPAPDGRPRFVLEVRPATNTVVVGPKESLAVGELAGARWSTTGEPLPERFACAVQVRAHADPVPATAAVTHGEVVVRPDEPIAGLAPGQSAVLYDGTRVLGQVTVDRTVAATALA
ncbi:tRNA 2-thiouridine(34) synthase MnmA [Amnibacterium sp. CER49]|uniref:tRNA 2-thiouridine(34) synthase MnmA n=1 Tax=Amnibacterium sp. CER49 TaxID=3039161 RepID=UPI00244B3AB3|nr:tRNA 2-thiouridine(34) synthase MnmA [Amnibacterium sp. CER49]MDH2442706.1 tRNA 2-thiouridine(34) synthase MnmA [Amnibacterium sp. CER49]